MNNPHQDDESALDAALRHDAARLPQPPFDAALHYATMRRIRDLSQHRPTRQVWIFSLSGAATLVLGIAAFLWHSGPSSSVTAPEGNTAAAAPTQASHAMAWSYRQGAAQSDEALLAMLDRDARTLLPPTAPTFTNPLN